MSDLFKRRLVQPNEQGGEYVARENMTQFVLYAFALAMGVAIAVLSILTTLSAIPALEYTSIGVLLGIGVSCLGLAGLDRLGREGKI